MPKSAHKRPATQASRARVAWRATRALVHIGLGVAVCTLAFPMLSRRRRARIVSWWARGFLAALGMRLQQHGAWPSTAGRYLLVSNHITWLDIFVIHAVEPVRFVSKSEVRSWPLAGYLATRAGTLYVDRARKRDTIDIGVQMHDVMAGGEAVGVFPEGTTSDGSVLLPFFSPLLQPAVRCQASLVPAGVRYRRTDGSTNTDLAFIGDQTFLQSVQVTLRQPDTRVEVRLGAPISCAGLHRRELTRLAEDAVAELLEVSVDHDWQASGTSGKADGTPPRHARSRRAAEARADAVAMVEAETAAGAATRTDPRSEPAKDSP
ncbi:MAG: 1-acyl-sn-glycerol-3-phosphate acyltransferase [Pseudomonadota bacterium]|nr:1-acyl-sn-glycerol-3-phosphate acyltransferase [Pseudomonadota bacterium]